MLQPTDHQRQTSETTGGRSITGNSHRLPVMGIPWNYPLKEVREGAEALGKIAGPIVIMTMLILSKSLISMCFLGRLSRQELAAGSLGLGVWNATGNSVMKGLAVRMDPICSQAFGAKNWSLISETFHKTLTLLFLVSIPITILWLNVKPLLLSLGMDREVSRLVGVFMMFLNPELFAQSALQPLRALLRTQGLTLPVTMASLFALILHVPINYVLVMHMGLGLRGVALGLSVNTINLDLGLLIYICASGAPVKPWKHRHDVNYRLKFRDLGQFVVPAVLSCLSVCSEWWWYNIMLLLCTQLSDNSESSIAAMGIMIQISGLLYAIPFSLNYAVLTCVGNALGAGRPCRANLISTLGVAASVAFGISSFEITTTSRSALARTYTNEPGVITLVASALPVLGLCELGNAPRTVASGVLMGTARPGLVARANPCSFYMIGIPVTLLLTLKLKFGFTGLWLGLLVSEISGTCMIFYALSITDWKYQARRAKEQTVISSGKLD